MSKHLYLPYHPPTHPPTHANKQLLVQSGAIMSHALALSGGEDVPTVATHPSLIEIQGMVKDIHTLRDKAWNFFRFEPGPNGTALPPTHPPTHLSNQPFLPLPPPGKRRRRRSSPSSNEREGRTSTHPPTHPLKQARVSTKTLLLPLPKKKTGKKNGWSWKERGGRKCVLPAGPLKG